MRTWQVATRLDRPQARCTPAHSSAASLMFLCTLPPYMDNPPPKVPATLPPNLDPGQPRRPPYQLVKVALGCQRLDHLAAGAGLLVDGLGGVPVGGALEQVSQLLAGRQLALLRPVKWGVRAG